MEKQSLSEYIEAMEKMEELMPVPELELTEDDQKYLYMIANMYKKDINFKIFMQASVLMYTGAVTKGIWDQFREELKNITIKYGL